jgi:endonuclease/exonuclease/phosphatase (EEP) superfamily protein YafD
VHLDFSRRSVRRSQAAELARVLSAMDGPLIVMSDFNTSWSSDESTLRLLADRLRLKVFQPGAPGLATYPDDDARLDWILVSHELDFVDHQVYPDIVSDHLAVVAELRLAAVAQ